MTMSKKLQALLELQKIRFDRACQDLNQINARVETLRASTQALRDTQDVEARFEDGAQALHHDRWRQLKLIELNLELACARAEQESCKDTCTQEFGRLQALNRLVEQAPWG